MIEKELSRKNVIVVGIGESGYAAARTLRRLGASVVAVDSSGSPSKADVLDELESDGVEVRLGVSVPDDLDRFDLLVTSPGVPDSAKVLHEARALKVKVISELELGYRLLSNDMIAVTGTNGKTTTTKLIASIMDRPDRRARVCGNIGYPLVGLYGDIEESDLLIVEVSSFQLQNIDRFRAKVSIILNLTPDHFDWHRDLEEYKAAKKRLVENQLEDDVLIYNAEDEFCEKLSRQAPGKTAGFGVPGKPGTGLWIQEGWITSGTPLPEERLMPVDEIQLPGEHNIENAMAAIGSALVMGYSPAGIRASVGAFRGLEHRMELAGMVAGVSFYNDSKATNPHAALSALKSFHEPTVAIMGGRNKGLDFTELMSEICRRFRKGQLKGLVLLGESAVAFRKSLVVECPSESERLVVLAGDMDESVEKAYRLCNGARIVLFSPACASFDMFTDYRERGRVFKESVGRLAGEVM